MIIQWITQFFNSLFPYTCILCSAPGFAEKDICELCYQDLPWIVKSCKRCGIHLPYIYEEMLCARCLKCADYFDKIFAPFEYQFPVRDWIIHLKFQHQLLYVKLLGKLFADYFFNLKLMHFPEVIIPVPLHVKRLKERGFNQSLELAKEVSQHCKIPIDYQTCKRIRETSPQSLLSFSKRKKNIKNAFDCHINFSAKHVAIFDDVITSAETVNALSKVLRLRQVEKIDIWCIARAGKI